MKFVIQRVKNANVVVENNIGGGLKVILTKEIKEGNLEKNSQIV